MDAIIQDIRYAFRVMRRNAGVTCTAVLAIALGIGANTAIFSVVNTVLLQPLPYPEADRLVQIWGENPSRGIPFHFVSYPDFAQWREQSRSYEAISAYRPDSMNLTGRDEPEQLAALRVNADFLAVAGETVLQGRGFLPDDDRPVAERVALLSHAFWRRLFGADPAVVGRPLALDGQSYLVIGILPATFTLGGSRVDLYVPLATSGTYEPANLSVSVGAYARLKPGLSIQQAQAELNTICRRLEREHPPVKRNARVWGLREFMVRNERTGLLILTGAVAFVLLIACTNVANILLARAGVRQQEIALRAVLGAARKRLVRQMLTESVVMSLLGGLLGILLAYWWITALVQSNSRLIPLMQASTLDLRVLGFACAATLLTGLLAGLAPARAVLLEGKADFLHAAMKQGGRTTAGAYSGNRLRAALVVSEVALALLLLVGAGLLIRSLARLQDINPGFKEQNVLTARISLPPKKYSTGPARAAFYREFLSQLEAMPDTMSAGLVSVLPLSGNNTGAGILIAGRPDPPPGEAPIVWWRAATSGYFQAMSIPLLKGRLFTDRDTPEAPGVALVTETMAKRFWPGEDVLGKQFSLGRPAPGAQPNWLTIVGIVGDIRHTSLAQEPDAEFFMPYSQLPYLNATVAVRTRADPGRFAPLLRKAVLAVDKDQPVSNIRSMEQILGDSIYSRRLNMQLLAVFAAAALFLAAIGIYGVVSYSVSRRTHEIGVRMTLGAQAEQVLAMVIARAMALVATGMILGLAAAVALRQVIRSQLYGVSTTDPLIFVAGPSILILVALLAAYFPARRAAQVDPLIALRQE